MTSPALEVGQSASSYEILAKLATGGMAEIFLARGASTGGVERYVVLKRVRRERLADAELARMFLDEARLSAQLQHPNIAQVYDVGQVNDAYFFTMEYVHGETVRGILQRAHALRQPIPMGAALTIAVGSAAGLHHAHERKGIDGAPLGIVHRDVSPSNLMVSFEGSVKVVDFGVAKAARRETESRSGTLKGKLAYMSPEQARGLVTIDRRSDIFSLGIVLWELLAHERLFKRASDFDSITAIVNEEVAPPSAHNAAVPRELDAIVLRMLAKRVDERFATADEVLDVLERFASSHGGEAMISVAALGRMVRELFGPRPEPWVDLASNARHDDAVTVTITSDPIPTVGRPLEQLTVADRPGALPTAPTRQRFDPREDMDRSSIATPPLTSAIEVPTAPTVPRAPVAPEPEVRDPSTSGTRIALFVLAPAVVIAIGIGVAIVVSDPASAKLVPRPTPLPTTATTTSTPPTAAQPHSEEPAHPSVSPAQPDEPAAHATEPAAPAEVVAPDAPRALDLAAALAAGDAAEVVVACEARQPPLAVADASTCTIAACRHRDLRDARRWLTRVPTAQRADTIAACAAASVELVPPPPQPQRPAQPKPTKPDCEHDPFACQD